MLIDKESSHQTVYKWIEDHTDEGKLDVVSGYFTVGALAWLSKRMRDKVTAFRFILGEMVDYSGKEPDALDLLNEDLSLDGALQLNDLAREAVEFLKLDSTSIKTLEPNFCHAKLFLFQHTNGRAQFNYYVTGSSNLTESGLGMKPTSNVELNHADFGAGDFKDYVRWFEDLWNSEKAHGKKTILHDDGRKEKVDFKGYIIQQIERIFQTHTPRDIYFKILFELYGSDMSLEENDADFNRKIGRLENTAIYKRLYEFQKKGVKSLIRMIDKYGGAILADAVGLGKTWTALAIIKHYEIEGFQSVVLCPKKLEQNWSKFFERDNLFYSDDFDYCMRFHTDLQDDRWEHPKYAGRNRLDLAAFRNSKPLLLIIDESHNLRNNKSARYEWLVNELLKRKQGKLKVLLLSATPINTSLRDLRNQFKLLVRNDDYGFKESDIAIGSIDYVFRRSTKAMADWQAEGIMRIGALIEKLPGEFMRLTDALLVARNRKWVASIEKDLHFPQKAKPENVFVTPKQMGTFESFEELFASFPARMSAYLPSFYIEEEKPTKVTQDERQREHFLVKMLQILLTKRLESSWKSLSLTVAKILDHHENALDKVQAFEKNHTKDDVFQPRFEWDEEEEAEMEKYTLGKKRRIPLSDIAKAGKLQAFKKDLKDDIAKLRQVKNNLESFEEKIVKELRRPHNYASADTKLEELIQRIRHKQSSGSNPKVIVFTVYADTANYLYDQLIARGFNGVAMVTGQGSRGDGVEGETKYFEPILERFAPYTKLYREKDWRDFRTTKSPKDGYDDWLEWVQKHHPEVYAKVQQPIDILIATDTLSEGQNLQDCDLVINYDIHWNPVRVIQRMGRIDRLGSPNALIHGINFWPTKDIDSYLYLKDRIEARMAAMRLAGAEVDVNFSNEFKEIAEDESLEKRQEAQMLRHMEHTLDETVLEEKSLGLDDFSMENFRQELEQALDRSEEYRNLPRGIFSGVAADDRALKEKGLVALLGTPRRPPNARNYRYQRYELIYVREDGSPAILTMKDLLGAMSIRLPEAETFVNEDLRKGAPAEIKRWKGAIEQWLKAQTSQVEDGAATSASSALLSGLAAGDLKAVKVIKKEETPDAMYRPENFDLVCWLTVQ